MNGMCNKHFVVYYSLFFNLADLNGTYEQYALPKDHGNYNANPELPWNQRIKRSRRQNNESMRS
ncbi:hypothetical protein VS_1505 [Vibrio atlanticus]|uniref:Uncharacterized protein n=1 Tax=Vibrio atlanticus (strain LGP32) TaxID=575788 RepID=B7VNU2_VIBA3|nr:hypothetical protein VS_1505 [Vibrio atlanticus]